MTAMDIGLTPSKLIRIEWNSVVGSIYRIKTSTNLVEGVWTDDFTDDISATKETTFWVDNVHTSAVDRLRFYRIQAVQ